MADNKDVLSAKKADENKLQQVTIHLDYLFKYGIDFLDRTIRISEEITEEMAFFVDVAISEMERQNGRKITLRINSLGGSVDATRAIISRMKMSKCTIVTEVVGLACSGAFYIAVAGDRRRIQAFSRMMHHSMSYRIPYDKHPTHHHATEIAEEESKELADFVASVSKMDTDFWYTMGRDKDFYMSAEEALGYGVVDEII